MPASSMNEVVDTLAHHRRACATPSTGEDETNSTSTADQRCASAIWNYVQGPAYDATRQFSLIKASAWGKSYWAIRLLFFILHSSRRPGRNFPQIAAWVTGELQSLLLTASRRRYYWAVAVTALDVGRAHDTFTPTQRRSMCRRRVEGGTRGSGRSCGDVESKRRAQARQRTMCENELLVFLRR